jgi:hypothetical protein
MSTFRQKGWGDRFDAYGAMIGFALFFILGLLLGSFTGWLAALALGFGAMHVTALIMRGRSGAQAPQPRDSAEQELASFAGPRFAHPKRSRPQTGE